MLPLVVSACAAPLIPEPVGPPSCGPLKVSNALDAPAAGGNAETFELQEPYVATMGGRTLGNEQVASIHFSPAVAWRDPVIHLAIEPGPDEDLGIEILNHDFNRVGWGTLFGIPGAKRFTFTGNTSDCQTVVEVQVVLDTQLRAKDVASACAQHQFET